MVGFPYSHYQLKVLIFVSVHLFNCDYFIEKSTQVNTFALLYDFESPQWYHLNISTESSMGCN